MANTGSPDSLGKGIEEIGGSFALGQWLAKLDASFKKLWNAWCSDIRDKQGVANDSSILVNAVRAYNGERDRQLIFNYSGSQAVDPLKISVEDSELLGQAYAILAEASAVAPLAMPENQSENRRAIEVALPPAQSEARGPLPNASSEVTLMPLGLTASRGLRPKIDLNQAAAIIPKPLNAISALPSSHAAQPVSVAKRAVSIAKSATSGPTLRAREVTRSAIGVSSEAVQPQTKGLAVPDAEIALRTGSFPRLTAPNVTGPTGRNEVAVFPKPASVGSIPPAAVEPTVVTLPDAARAVVAPLPQTVHAAEGVVVDLRPSGLALPDVTKPVASAAPPAADGPAEFISAGQYLLPIKPSPSGESTGQTLGDAIASFSAELPQAASDILGHLQVRQTFLVVKSDFKGLVLEVELDEPTFSVVRLSLARARNSWEFGGEVIIARPDKAGASQPPLVFTLVFSSDKTSRSLVMELEGEINLVDDLLRPLFGHAIEIPDGLSLNVVNPVMVFVRETSDGAQPSTKALLSVAVQTKVDLGDLPFVGQTIKAQGAAQISLGLQYASSAFPADQIAEINKVLSSDAQFTTPDAGPFNGLHLSAALQMTGKPLRLSLPLSANDADNKPQSSATGGSLSSSPTAGSNTADPTIHWINMNRSVGPAYLEKVGLGFSDGAVQFRVNASVAMSGLSFFCEGLGAGLKLKWPPQPPTFNLDGLGIGMDVPPVSISGALMRTSVNGHESFDGLALIKAANFTITGIGSYTKIDGDPSLFLFAVLHKDLGGPAFFHVTGLAAGFGFNRALELPPIEAVQDFPLVRGALDENYFSIAGSPQAGIQLAKQKLNDYIPPASGEYWFAAGIRFNSFEMIQSFALLSVSFGHEVVIGLLGLSRMTLPKGAEPGSAIASAELALRAVIKIDEGSIAVEGRLTDNSYVFSKDCRLTGGFAFYTWFRGEHSGDFVITLGGYHPRFMRPAHYPVVPRLGVTWQISSRLKVTAEFYFALTPSCLMAGGKMSAVYDAGAITAWYIAYVDFLLSWQPFYYLIDIGITIGVKADLGLFSISVHLGVDLHIWGPEFAGEIDVDLSVVSFSIRFGPDKAPPAPLTPSEFVTAFLPAPKPASAARANTSPRGVIMLRASVPSAKSNVVAAQINSGLIRQENRMDNDPLRVVNGHALALSVKSLIPVTSFSAIAPNDGTSVKSSDLLGVRAMGKTSLAAALSVSIRNVRDTNKKPAEQPNLRVTTIEDGVPEALWGKSLKEGEVPPVAPEAKTIQATLGIRIAFAPIHPQGALPPMDIEKFAYETFNKPIPWDASLVAPPDFSADEIKNESLATIMSVTTTTRRNDVLDVLQKTSPFVLNKVDLSELVAHRESYFQADPILCRLGSVSESIA